MKARVTQLLRPTAALGATVLLAVSLTACGGPPTDASEKDFCDALDDLSWSDGLDADSTGAEIVDALQAWADRLEDTGTPKGIPDDARDGFEITIDTVHGLEGDDFENADDLGSVEDNLSTEDQEKVDALTDYQDQTCPDA